MKVSATIILLVIGSLSAALAEDLASFKCKSVPGGRVCYDPSMDRTNGCYDKTIAGVVTSFCNINNYNGADAITPK